MLADECKKMSEPAWSRYANHPWFDAMENGTLPIENFIAFQVADAPFVPQIHRTLALGLSRAPAGSAWSRAAATLLSDVFLATEMEAKRSVLAGLGVHECRFDRWALTPAREAYANHLVLHGLTGTAGQIAAALLPCALFSEVVGRRFEAVHVDGPPSYKEWADIYAKKQVYRMAEAHAELMEDEAERGSDATAEMTRIFVRSVQHQVRVFDDALANDRGWPEASLADLAHTGLVRTA